MLLLPAACAGPDTRDQRIQRLEAEVSRLREQLEPLVLQKAEALSRALEKGNETEIEDARTQLKDLVGEDESTRWLLAALLIRWGRAAEQMDYLRERYTDEHPEVVRHRERMDLLTQAVSGLAREVGEVTLDAAAVAAANDLDRRRADFDQRQETWSALERAGLLDAAWRERTPQGVADAVVLAVQANRITDLDTLWIHLGSKNYTDATLALWAMAERGDEAVAFLRTRLDPPPVEPKDHEALILALDADDVAERDRATEALLRAGADAHAAVEAALQSPSPEVRARAARILRHIGEPSAPDPTPMRRAVRVFEIIGTPEAEVLRKRYEAIVRSFERENNPRVRIISEESFDLFEEWKGLDSSRRDPDE